MRSMINGRTTREKNCAKGLECSDSITGGTSSKRMRNDVTDNWNAKQGFRFQHAEHPQHRTDSSTCAYWRYPWPSSRFRERAQKRSEDAYEQKKKQGFNSSLEWVRHLLVIRPNTSRDRNGFKKASDYLPPPRKIANNCSIPRIGTRGCVKLWRTYMFKNMWKNIWCENIDRTIEVAGHAGTFNVIQLITQKRCR